MNNARIAVVMFPGSNCEEETARVCRATGMEAEILRWNTRSDVSSFDGYVLPGGWSYEDRIRAGAIASKDGIMKAIAEESGKGKPVLGICNGAQVLIESSIIPGIKKEVQMALAANINPLVSGYYCTWVYNRSCVAENRTAFTRLLTNGEVFPIPVAHGEGRFTTREESLLARLADKNQIVFRYCDASGKDADGFPANPNGSAENIAAICNPEGNVMAMMPHPERCSWKGQLPGFEGKAFAEMNSPGPGRKIFDSIRKFIEEEGKSWR